MTAKRLNFECLDIDLVVKDVASYVDSSTKEVGVVPAHIDVSDEANGKMYSLSWGLMVGSFKEDENKISYEIEGLRVASAYKKESNTYTEVAFTEEEERDVFESIKNQDSELVCSFRAPFGGEKVLKPEDVVKSKIDIVTVTPTKYKIATPEYAINYGFDKEAEPDEMDR